MKTLLQALADDPNIDAELAKALKPKKPAPCRCAARCYPHRRDNKCEALAEEERKEDDGEEWVDGTPKDVINMMRAEVGRG